MKVKILAIILTLFSLSVIAQPSNILAYPQHDDAISDNKGTPKDSFSFYFPELDFKGSDFELKWFSSELFAMREKILYNNYLGRDIYRFTLLRSFGNPMTIKIVKYDDSVFIYRKEMSSDASERRRGSFQANEKSAISIAELNELLSLIDSVKLFSRPTFLYNHQLDGSAWIVEVHNKDGYYYSTRWDPEDPAILAFGRFMIDHSDLHRKEKKKKP